MRHRLIQITFSVLALLICAVVPALAQTTFNYDFEDGLRRGTSVSMAVPTTIQSDGDGNKFMRITASSTDCQSVPDDLCPGTRTRSTVRFTASAASMPLLTAGSIHWTYSARIRFSTNSGTDASVFSLFQDGTISESYASSNGTGPVVRLWRGTGTQVHFMSHYDNETKTQSVTRTVSSGAWHTYKVVAIWSHTTNIGRIEYYFDGQLVQTVSGRDVCLGPDSNRIPEFKMGLYGSVENGTTIDIDDVQAYPTDQGPPAPPGGGEPPPPSGPRQLFVSTTGSGTTCTSSAPCSFTQAITSHNGGDTITLGNGSYNVTCNDCLKSGTSTRSTILESANLSGTSVAVGKDKTLVSPGLATMTANSTAATLRIASGRQYITLRNMKIASTGSGSEPVVQVNDSNGIATGPVLIQNVEVESPNRTAGQGIYVRGPSTSHHVTIRQVRLHDNHYGIFLIGTDHVVEQSDAYNNRAAGFLAWPGGTLRTDRITFQGNRSFNNTLEGIVVGAGTDMKLIANDIFENHQRGILIGSTASRFQAYNNTLYQNSQQAASTFPGLEVQTSATGIVKNNISIGHPAAQYVVASSPSTTNCTNNLSSQASESQASACTNFTFGATAAGTWVDPTNATLASRNFGLVTSPTPSLAIDNGTASICTSANAGANLCTPVLLVAGYPGIAPDQGAHEAAAVVTGQLIADYDLDSDFLDLTAQNNDGTATSVTFDTTNEAQGTGAALFNALGDRITIPLGGASLTNGLTIAMLGRVEVLGTLRYMFGHTASAPGYTHRIQMKLDEQDRYFIGIGSTRDALITTATVEAGKWYRFGLVVGPASPTGTGSYQAYVDGVQVGSGTYSGLSTIAATAALGNDAGQQIYGWGSNGNAQLDKARIWNYPLSATEMAADCDSFCVDPPVVGTFELGPCAIGPVNAQTISCSILSGADPAVCSPLSNWQVTYAAVSQTETACSVTGTASPQLRITLSAAALATDEVILTYANFDDPITVDNLITPACGPLQFTSCTTSVDGLQVRCNLGSPLCGNVCPPLTDFLVRDDCVTKGLTACSASTSQGFGNVQLTRASPPASQAVDMDVLYFPTDQRVGVTNLFNPATPPPDDPPTTGINQTQWRFRPVGRSDTEPWDGLPNRAGRVASPGAVAMRIAIANQSGATVTGLRTSLWASRKLPGGDYSNFVRVEGGTETAPYNSIGLRYDPPSTFKIADNTQLASPALPIGGGLTELDNHRYRRSGQAATGYTLANGEQVEEEHAVEVTAGIPLKTNYVFRIHDATGTPLASYTGVAGCTNDPEPFGVGEVPCGALLIVGPPRQR